MIRRHCANRLPCILLRLVSDTVLCLGLVLSLVSLPSPTQAATVITETTGAGNLSTQLLPPSGNVYGITGGTTVGTNLYHSFAQFDVGTGDIAQFQTAALIPNPAMLNILGRITDTNPSIIFGTIDSATYYPGASLFLMNPHGFLFGPNATVNVAAMVAFTTADYLRLVDNARFEAIPGTQDALLSTFPVAAFGFLGSNPSAISIQGSTLSVQTGQSLQFVGGSHGFTYTNPDTDAMASVADGVTMTGASLSASGGQIGVASLASPGEIFNQTMVAGPNINGETFTDHGLISMSGGATLNVSDNGGGTIRILSGQFVMDNAFLVANTTGSSDGMPVAVSLNVSGDIAITDRSAISARTSNTGRGGDVDITSATLFLSGGSRIGTQTSGTGQAGDMTITVSDMVSLGGTDNLENPTRIESETVASGRSGSIDLVASTVTLDNQAVIRTQAAADGAAGNITLHVENLLINNGGRIENTGSEFAPSGNINVTATDTITLSGNKSDIENRNEGFGGTGTITLDTNNLVMSDRARVLNSTLFSLPAPGDSQLSVQAHNSINMTTGSEIRVFNFSGDAGGLNLSAKTINLSNAAKITSVTSADGNAGTITIQGLGLATPAQSVLIDGSGSGIFTDTQGTGEGGAIFVNANSVTLTHGATVSASSTGQIENPGDAGNIDITATNRFMMQNSKVTTQANQASGGAIKISTTPSGTVQLTDSTISASVLDGTGGGGSVNIDPQLVILQNSQISAKAVRGPGGNISITTNLLLQDATSEISASSRFGLNGTVTIQSPNSPASGKINPLRNQPLQATSLLNQHCAALAEGQFSSFTVAGRDILPAEPGSWLASPLATLSAGRELGVNSERVRSGVRDEGLKNITLEAPLAGESTLLPLRQIAPSGFLTQAFAVDWSAGCQS